MKYRESRIDTHWQQEKKESTLQVRPHSNDSLRVMNPCRKRKGARGLTDFEANVARLRIGLAGVTQEDVLRFEIAVDDAFDLQGAHGAGQLLQEAADRVLAQRPFHCTRRKKRQAKRMKYDCGFLWTFPSSNSPDK